MTKIKLYGDPENTGLYPVRDFLNRSVLHYETIDPEQFPQQCAVKAMVPEHPVEFAVEFPDGHVVINPTIQQIADHLGWIKKPRCAEYDLSIYGAGPAGLSAAVYAASEGLRTVLVEKEAIGGQAGTTSLIENYMGFPKGISGAELAERARQQAQKFGVEILQLREGVRGRFEHNRIHVDMANGEQLVARANICATGVEYIHLNLPGEERYINRGLYYGAGASEACFCKGKDIFVVGGGNSAGQAATYFSGFARKVYMVIRKGNLSDTLSDYLVKRINTIPNIEVMYHVELNALEGDKTLSRIRLRNSREDTERWYDAGKTFICIGGKPNTEWAAESGICRDPNGYLITGRDLIGRPDFSACWSLERQPYHLETSRPGSFAAGDVRFNAIKRVASAVGEGAMAVTQVHQYLATI